MIPRLPSPEPALARLFLGVALLLVLYLLACLVAAGWRHVRRHHAPDSTTPLPPRLTVRPPRTLADMPGRGGIPSRARFKPPALFPPR